MIDGRRSGRHRARRRSTGQLEIRENGRALCTAWRGRRDPRGARVNKSLNRTRRSGSWFSFKSRTVEYFSQLPPSCRLTPRYVSMTRARTIAAFLFAPLMTPGVIMIYDLFRHVPLDLRQV